MTDPCLHRFAHSIKDIPLPTAFTYPFHYTPHPLTLIAAEEVQTYLHQRTDWQKELEEGKMFGVLIVQDEKGSTGYLTAFSGNLAGSNRHTYFIPPVYDLLCPDGFFKKEENKISAINRHIQTLQQSGTYLRLRAAYAREKEDCLRLLQSAKDELRQAKLQREERRKAGISPEEEAELIRESQFGKAEYKRLERKLKTQTEASATDFFALEKQIDALKHERKTRSATLQQKLFSQFRMLNARGETKDLCQIFRDTPQGIPPAGAGECALPKLLQYAYLHHFRPLAMGEFWYGRSPKEELRREGYFYPSCKSKCEPILKHMLTGLNVEPNPLCKTYDGSQDIEIVYEDEWLLVINKPCGLLSTPGKTAPESVYSFLLPKYTNELYVVHRLDMATSGLLLIAKSLDTYRILQAQFTTRQIEKRYTALLDGIVTTDKGTISLPLCPDYHEHPRQKVHLQHGKPAITRYQVLERKNGRTRIAFFPLTGRTHQLRIHAAHPDGLDCPITGDELYGKKAERLYLHAAELKFTHPVTNKQLIIRKEAEF